jgi:hypothetical protein
LTALQCGSIPIQAKEQGDTEHCCAEEEEEKKAVHGIWFGVGLVGE